MKRCRLNIVDEQNNFFLRIKWPSRLFLLCLIILFHSHWEFANWILKLKRQIPERGIPPTHFQSTCASQNWNLFVSLGKLFEPKTYSKIFGIWFIIWHPNQSEWGQQTDLNMKQIFVDLKSSWNDQILPNCHTFYCIWQRLDCYVKKYLIICFGSLKLIWKE